MGVDPRLNEIDDSLYRVAVRALIVQDRKVLLVKEVDGENWWAIPGGGIDHGETMESSLVREIEEELGVPDDAISCDFQIAHYNIGRIVNGVPRMNVFFKASVPENLIKKTAHVEKWSWFTEDEFFKADINPSYDKAKLADVTFGSLA